MSHDNRPILWYDTPATTWNEALPLGNGRIAAMVMPENRGTTFFLNEETIFSGSPYNNVRLDAVKHLEAVRDYIRQDDAIDAQEEVGKYFNASKDEYASGSSYMPAGILDIQYDGKLEQKNYRRELMLDSALSRVIFQHDKAQYEEQSFVSFVDNVMYVQLKSDKKGGLNFQLSLNYPCDSLMDEVKANGNGLKMFCHTPGFGSKVPSMLKFCIGVLVDNMGGKVLAEENMLRVKDADSVTIRLSIASNFVNYHDVSANAEQRVDSLLKAGEVDFNQAKMAHVAYYKKQFDRVKLNLGENKYDDETTAERIKNFESRHDNFLTALLYQYGRYLLISSSQPGCQPANLQGKWNKDVEPSWGGRYTLDVNTEMNYWPVESSNLPELDEPYITMVEELAEQGEASAKEMYGCRGWMVHHNTDLWRFTGMVAAPKYGCWQMAGAWLCDNLWQHYLYSGDEAYLKKIYPVIKGAAEFYSDYLELDTITNCYVTNPSYSPENTPEWSYHECCLFKGVTMDNELLFNLFSIVGQASDILGCDEAFAKECVAKRDSLLPLFIGKRGQLQEWMGDWDSERDQHRHLSHLWALYPGSLITPVATPAAFMAAKQSLEERGEYATGWSLAWKIGLWTRLFYPSKAYKLIHHFIHYIEPDNNVAEGVGGVYPNLLCAHPPFQIDGNLGYTAAVDEMMVQCHDGMMYLLPSIPSAWKDGSVEGLRMVGGFVLQQMEWKKGQVNQAVIKATVDGNLRICSATELSSPDHNLQKAVGDNPNPLFHTQPSMHTMLAKGNGYISIDKRMSPETLKLYVYDVYLRKGESVTLTSK